MQTTTDRAFLKPTFPIAVCSLLIGLTGCEKPEQKPEIPPPSVVVSDVKQETVPIIIEVAGTVQPVKTVKIVPRVSGYIFERNFTEGSSVSEGDPLYLVDPRPYQSKLDTLKARLKEHQASLEFWNSEAKRFDRLAQQGNVSQEDKERNDAKKAEVEASIEADKADIENAELDLSFTKITAPFSGRIQDTLVHVGDLVQKHQTELTTVVQIDPIYVKSNVSRAQVYRVQQLQQQGLAPKAAKEFSAQLVMPDGSIYSHPGTLNYISALIDPSTDTTEVRFEFPNPAKGAQLSLIPGQYIPLRMIVGHQPDALLIPEQSLLQTQEGTHVFVVGKHNKVEKRMVTLGASHEQQWIVNEGLKQGERVIAEGVQKVRPGMDVKVTGGAAEKPAS
jgi:membrane fusion protein (multidrug efflux system)